MPNNIDFKNLLYVFNPHNKVIIKITETDRTDALGIKLYLVHTVGSDYTGKYYAKNIQQAIDSGFVPIYTEKEALPYILKYAN